MKLRGSREPNPHHGKAWNDPCLGCGVLVLTCCPNVRLCPDCYAELFERLAHAVEPKYDPKAENTWAACERVLLRWWPPEDYGTDKCEGRF